MVLHGALRVISAAQMRRAAVRCPALGKFSQKGIPLSFNSSLERFPSPFSRKISQRVHDSVSTRKFDDGSLLHDGGGSFGWWLVSQRQTNKMHRRRSNRPDTRFTHGSFTGRPEGKWQGPANRLQKDRIAAAFLFFANLGLAKTSRKLSEERPPCSLLTGALPVVHILFSGRGCHKE